MWSVVILSPTLIAQSALRDVVSGSPFGTGAMFGPRTISVPFTPFPAVLR